MAEIQISYINPIRFRPTGDNDVMPRIDKMQNRVQYYKGVYPLPEYRANWKINEQIQIQIQTDLSAGPALAIALVVITPSTSVTIEPTVVTPSTWTGNTILNYNYTPSTEGDYYFYTITRGPTIEQQFISDEFRVRSNDLDLVEIKYSDTDNRFDGVFYDGTTQIWSPKAYFTGISMPGKPKSESSIYTDDQSTPVRTKGTTQRTIDVKFTDITINHYSQLIDIFTCDTNYINNQPCIMVDEFDSEGIEKSDGCDVSLNMIRVEDNNFIKNY